MRILGISAFYHDSAAALVEDGRIIAAAQEERFTRKKQDARYPENAIRYCLDEGGLTLAELDYIVFYEKPFIKFERLIETYLAFAPRFRIVPHGFAAVAKGKIVPKELAWQASQSARARLRLAAQATIRGASPEPCGQCFLPVAF